MTPNELPPQVVDLPPLPPPFKRERHWDGETIAEYFTADQMREYARTALSTLTAQGGEAWQVLKDDGTHSFFTMSRTEAEDYKHGLGRTVIPCTIAPTPPAPSSSAVEGKRERLENERWRMMNAFGGSAFHDGAVQKRIDEIDAELKALASTAASGGDVVCNHSWPAKRTGDVCRDCRKSAEAPAMPEYETRMGEAGQRYIESVALNKTHTLPAQFRWHELWEVLLAASAQGDGDGK